MGVDGNVNTFVAGQVTYNNGSESGRQWRTLLDAPDYARFTRMILNGGSLDGKRYLKPESVTDDELRTGDLKTGFTPGNGWGLTWCVVREPQDITAMLSPSTHGHGGAYGTQAWIDPVKGVALILMVQRANFGNSDNSPPRLAFQQAAAGQ